MSTAAVLGLDIGGTKTAAGVVDARGRLRSNVRAATPAGTDAEALLRFVATLARAAVERSPVPPAAVGVGCGGPMRWPDGVTSPLHIPAWRDFPLRAELERALGLPAVVDNDAKAFALGQARFGAGRGARCLLGMVVSTGVGGGVVAGGRLLHGASGNAGHIGHVVVRARGPRCECGARGCVTVYASGPSIATRAGRATAEAAAEAARRGDPLAGRVLRDAASALAHGIAAAACVADLDRVVIGGGVAEAGDLLFVPLRREVRRFARLDFLRELEVLPAPDAAGAGIVGAASLALR